MVSIITIGFFVAILPIVLLGLYPVVSYVRASLFPDPVRKDLSFRPPVSILLACYNEERYIRERLEALLDPSEWIPGSELLIVSTGSTDRTNEILEEYRDRTEVRLFLEGRITKIQALNLAFQHTRHDYLVFSDCRQYMQPGSVAQLVANLNDERVGTVTSTLLDTRAHPSFFRRLYRFLARHDSRASSTFNLYGALYAQRRDTFRPIPEHLLFDDLFVAVSTLAQRKRLVQEEQAVLHDVPFPDYYNRERLERLVRGLLIFLFRSGGVLQRVPWPTRLRLLLYKYIKVVLPILLAVAGLTGSILWVSKLSSSVVLLAVLAGLLVPVLIFARLRRSIWLLCRIQAFFLIAVIGYAFFNRRSKHWEPLRIRRWFFARNAHDDVRLS